MHAKTCARTQTGMHACKQEHTDDWPQQQGQGFGTLRQEARHTHWSSPEKA